MASKPIKSGSGYADYHTKPQVNMRLSDEGVVIIEQLQMLYGIGRSAVVELALRRLAQQEKRAGNL